MSSHHSINKARTKKELSETLSEVLNNNDPTDYYHNDGLNTLRKELNYDISWNTRNVTLYMAKKRAISNIFEK